MIVHRSLFLILLLLFLGCKSDPIKDRPISFSPWRAQETIKYINDRYDRNIQTLEMLPVMVVSHFTAMDSLEVSFNYMNKEEMEAGRDVLKKAGAANIAVQFLVAKSGDVYRLMPENHIGRHVIGLNRHAIGIENVGKDEKALTKEQVQANAFIVRHLVKKFPIRYLIGHSEYRGFEHTPLWEEQDTKYRTEKVDPGESFMQPLRAQVADLNLSSRYDGSEIPARLEYLLAAYHKKGEFNGTALVMRRGEAIFRKSYGVAGGSGERLLVPADTLYLASAAKSITAVLMARLEAQKKIRFNTPVAKFFPQLKHLLSGVEVRHLLSHTSGLEDYYKLATPAPGLNNADALVAIANQKKSLAKPGQKFYYANSNYVLLAEIAKAVTGKDFVDLLSQEIFSPLGITSHGFAARGEATKQIPSLDETGKIFTYPYATTGSGGMYLNADDLARFDLALMEHKLLGAVAWARLAKAEAVVTAKETHYGFGWYVYPERGVIYHDGNFGGYHTMNWLQTKDKNAIILLANRYTTKIKEITYEIDRVLNGLGATKLK